MTSITGGIRRYLWGVSLVGRPAYLDEEVRRGKAAPPVGSIWARGTHRVVVSKRGEGKVFFRHLDPWCDKARVSTRPESWTPVSSWRYGFGDTLLFLPASTLFLHRAFTPQQVNPAVGSKWLDADGKTVEVTSRKGNVIGYRYSSERVERKSNFDTCWVRGFLRQLVYWPEGAQ